MHLNEQTKETIEGRIQNGQPGIRTKDIRHIGNHGNQLVYIPNFKGLSARYLSYEDITCKTRKNINNEFITLPQDNQYM